MADTNKKYNWLNTISLTLTFILACTVVPWYGVKYGFTGLEWSFFGIFMVFTGTGITVGYHRLWSHKTYEANAVFQSWFAFWGAVAAQNSIISWSRDHRDHHKFVDNNDKDPYSAKKGFWFSHILWIFKDTRTDKDYGNVKDLQANKICVFQEKYYMLLLLIGNFALPMGIGYLCHTISPHANGMWHSMAAMFLLAGLLRFVLNHHFTFFINSLAHIIGSQPYAKKDTSRDNFFLALLTYGEGYHNFHHTFQSDYRNGVRAWQFDPSKWIIWSASKIGMTRKLKRMKSWQISHKKQEFWGIQALENATAHLKNMESSSQHLKDALEKSYESWMQALNDWTSERKKSSDINKTKLADLQEVFIAKRDAFTETLNSIFRNQQAAPSL
jgi:stearoyl-CoA desaturase (Delta-9 desaturase)